jgi:hypothetical protein
LAGRRRHRQQEFLKFLRTLDLRLGEAMRASYEMVKQAGFWEHLSLVVIDAVIASLASGAVALPATPFLIAAVVAGYYVAAGKGDELERAAVCRDAQTGDLGRTHDRRGRPSGLRRPSSFRVALSRPSAGGAIPCHSVSTPFGRRRMTKNTTMAMTMMTASAMATMVPVLPPPLLVVVAVATGFRSM